MPSQATQTRREFLQRVSAAGLAVSVLPASWNLQAASGIADSPALLFPGPWQFLRPRSSIILVSDQQLQDLRDADKPVDLSLSKDPNVTTLRKLCEQAKARGARTIILAFDEFWTQYRQGQSGKPRELLPDTEEYIACLSDLSKTVQAYGLGFELSLLSPLEVGRGYERKTGETGRWVQYREGYRDPNTGKYNVSLWEQRQWTNNKGTIELKRVGIRVFAFREHRVGGTAHYAVDPASIITLSTPPEIEADESAVTNTKARRMTVRGTGAEGKGLDRVLVVVSYAVPEMDYFSPKALPFLRGLIEQYHEAGIPLNGLYADEMHIQQDWGYFNHHDEGQFTMRYLSANLARKMSEELGTGDEDFEKHLVYFCYGQHGFYPTLEARLPAQHVLGSSPDAIQRTFLMRRRYYHLLENSVVDLFAAAKRFAEEKYGHELEARAHATWAQSPTIDLWKTGEQHLPPRQYEYTPDFIWSNTVQQASSACSDYFAWNAFLTGGGNDHAEGGWLDRNYYGIALACSTGILNSVPYAYAAAWGMPGEIHQRHQDVCDAFGASASPWFQAVEDSQHRDVDVLMLYPHSLVATEERFGSWMVQYGYANYVTPAKLIEHGKVTDDGRIEMAGRSFRALAVLFEPFPPTELLDLMEMFVERGGKLIWSGPAPRLDFQGNAVLARWQKLFGIERLGYGIEGRSAAGWKIEFDGRLGDVPEQAILTDLLVDHVYPVKVSPGVEVVARLGSETVGAHRSFNSGGRATFLGFRPRDDQSASLGGESATWFEVLKALGAYPASGKFPGTNDNPSVLSRTNAWAACAFPNGTTALAIHYSKIVEHWPGGFHRDRKQDEEIVKNTPMPATELVLDGVKVNGHTVSYRGSRAVAFRSGEHGTLISFAGYGCRGITVDGRETVFSTEPLGLAAWAPVLPERRVEGGAVLELWLQGDGEVTIPLSERMTGRSLHLRGRTIDTFGTPVDFKIDSGSLRFKVRPEWGQAHLFLA